MTINDLRLRTKSLIPLALMALVMLGMVVFDASRLIGVSETASDIIETRDLAAFKLVRVGRLIVQIPYAVEAGINIWARSSSH